MATDSIFLMGAVDAYKYQETASCDLPEVFLHTVAAEKEFIGELCELMFKVNHKINRTLLMNN